jgi:hypothetical protein
VSTEANVAGYEPWEFPLFRSEEILLRRILRPGRRVLDLGCGNGRVSSRRAGCGRVRRGGPAWAPRAASAATGSATSTAR